MQLTTDKQSLLRALLAARAPAARQQAFRTGLELLDELAPGGEFQYGAVHELLHDPKSHQPKTIAMIFAKAAQQMRVGTDANPAWGAVVWSDPAGELYPPALLASGITDLRRLILLRCTNPEDELWAIAECLRCPGVSATVASVGRLTQLQARRLQLAAERGGGVGILMRQYSSRSQQPYAAATRWHIRPISGTDQNQRWNVQLLHGHGLRPDQLSRGQLGQTVVIEVNRETRAVRASASVADRSTPPQGARASA
jgi:protein ImuA